MFKYKYFTLKKDEKKEAKKGFYSTPRGKSLKVRHTRLVIYGLLLLLFGIYLLIDTLLKEAGLAFLIYSILIMIMGLLFIISKYYLMVRDVNKYIVTKKTTK